MKLNNVILLSTLVLAACGTKKNPVGSDLNTIRSEGKVQTEAGPQGRQVEQGPTVYVDRPTVVTKEESTVDGKLVTITADSSLQFHEGQTTSYKIRVSVLVPGGAAKLSITGLPDATADANKPQFVASTTEAGLYTLTWTPAYNLVSTSEEVQPYAVKIDAQVTAATSADDLKKLKSIVRELNVPAFLFRTQELPSGLKIADLGTEVTQGDVVPFTITARVPGVDDKSAQKPSISLRYDGKAITTGNNFQELDGTRYVLTDTTKTAEYLGDYQWKFHLLFDTKNISVSPELDLNGKVLAGADGTRVRFNVKVVAPAGVLATPETLTQVKIKYVADTTAAPAVAPATPAPAKADTKKKSTAPVTTTTSTKKGTK